jgi:aminoglycoside phosphotransferase (APT) family kinase protein
MSSFRLEEVDVFDDDGSSVSQMWKDVGPEGLSADARRSRPDFLTSPDREIRVYETLLPAAPPGAPRCYGVVDEPSRRWLRLERIAGLELRYSASLPIWQAAVEWIGAFHERCANLDIHRLATDLDLIVYNADYYRCWMTRAQQFNRTRDARAVLAQVAGGFERVVEQLCGLPRTIIHGEYYPSNILIEPRGDRVRVAPVDWEMTAVGPGLVDVAALSAGWDEAARGDLLSAYTRPTPAVIANLDCCRLYLALRMLGWSDSWTPPFEHAFDWLREAAQAAERLDL